MKISKHIQTEKAFTLVEMLVVVAIVAIIVTIVGVALAEALKKSRDTKLANTINQVEAAKIHYYMDTKDAGEPPLNLLANYIRNEGMVNSGPEIFYTVQGWEAAGNPPTANAGALLGGIPGAFRIKPNIRGTKPELVAVP
jgi:prepilin-type N-terminal cleavage/methylation domain-containing protein